MSFFYKNRSGQLNTFFSHNDISNFQAAAYNNGIYNKDKNEQYRLIGTLLQSSSDFNYEWRQLKQKLPAQLFSQRSSAFIQLEANERYVDGERVEVKVAQLATNGGKYSTFDIAQDSDMIQALLMAASQKQTMAMAAKGSGVSDDVFPGLNVFSMGRKVGIGYGFFKTSQKLQVEYTRCFALDDGGVLNLFSPANPTEECYFSILRYILVQKLKADRRVVGKFETLISANVKRGFTLNDMLEFVSQIEYLSSQIRVWELTDGVLVKGMMKNSSNKRKYSVQCDVVLFNNHFYVLDGNTTINEESASNSNDFQVCHNCKRSFKNRQVNKHLESCIGYIAEEQFFNDLKGGDYEPYKFPRENFEYFKNQSNIKYDILNRRMSDGLSTVLIGAGGMGKSYLLNRVLDDFEGGLVLCPTARACSNFKKAFTWHSLVHALEKYFVDPECGLMEKFSDMKYLIIDEVSMVTSRDLIRISKGLGRFHNNKEHFGGLRFIICGDAVQLPPVTPNDNFVDFWFSVPFIKQLVNNGGFIELHEPMRFISHVNTIDELGLLFSDILEGYRMGKKSEEFERIVKQQMKPVEYLDDLFIDENVGVIALTNNDVVKIMGRRLKKDKRQLFEFKGKVYGKTTTRAYVGMRMMVSDNREFSNIHEEKIINGTFITITKYDDETKRIYAETDIGTKIDFSSVKFTNVIYGDVITIHKSQGQTYDQLVIYAMGYYRNLTPGQFYVAISRCRSLKNISLICDSTERFFSLENCDVYVIARQFAKYPTKFIPMNTIYEIDEQGRPSYQYQLTTSRKKAVYCIKDKRVLNNKGKFADFNLSQSDKLKSNVVFYDCETKSVENEGTSNYLEWFSVACRFYFGCELTNPCKIINDIIPQLDKEWFKYADVKESVEPIKQTFIVDETGALIWDWETSNTVGFDFFNTWYQFAVEVVKIYKVYAFYKKDEKKKTPMVLNEFFKLFNHGTTFCGFNNNNFDDFQIINEFIQNTDSFGLQLDILPGGGSNTKGFVLTLPEGYAYDAMVLLKSHDIGHLTGPGSLAKHFETFVKPSLGDRNSIIDCLLTVYEKASIGINYDIDQVMELDYFISDKNTMTPWEKLQISNERSDYFKFVKGSSVLANFWINWGLKDQKKGVPPLKLVQSMDRSDYLKFGESVNLFELVGGDGEENLKLLFFERELGKVSELNMDDLKRFNLKKELREYVVSDVEITEALYRSYNNLVYTFAPETYKNASGHNGLRISVLKLKTMTSFTELFMGSTLPPELTMKRTTTQNAKCNQKDIITKMCLYPTEINKIFSNVAGGKVLPRRIYSEMKSDDDWYTYLDSSGMYGFAMENYEYPYGGYRILYPSIDGLAFQKMQDDFDTGVFIQGNNWGRCRFMNVTVSLHPKEMEPPYGIKTDKGVRYQNNPTTLWLTNVTIRDILASGGRVHKIYMIIEWQFQSKYLSPCMNYFNTNKNKPGQSSGFKAIYKGLANRVYGLLLKKDDSAGQCITDNKDEFFKIMCNMQVKRINIVGDKVLMVYNDDSDELCKRPAVNGAFVLSYSKHDQNMALEEAFGEDRHSIGFRDLVTSYGDTDSIVLHSRHLRRLVELDDAKVSHLDKRLYMPDKVTGLYNQLEKPGKLTDEIADDMDKYITPEHANALKKQGFPDLRTGYCGVVSKIFSPAPKVNFVQLLFPPAIWNGKPTSPTYFPNSKSDWVKGKCKITVKGAPRGSTLRLEGESMETSIEFNNDQEVFDLFFKAFNEGKGVVVCKMDKLQKFGFNLPTKDRLGGLLPFQITSKPIFERTIFRNKWVGRELVKKITPTGTNFFDKYEPYTLALGHQEEPYSDDILNIDNFSGDAFSKL
jgi:PIF1-like helicase